MHDANVDQIVNISIMQPHLSDMICKVGDINCSDQCAEDLCIYKRRMSVAKTEAGLLPNGFANLCEK